MSAHLSQTQINTLLTPVPVLGSSVTISGAAAATGLIKLTATAHGIVANASAYIPLWVVVMNVGGTVEANGFFPATVTDVNHITLTGTTFVNAYTSGGTLQVLTFSAGTAAGLTAVNLNDLVFSTEHTVWQPATAIGTTLAVAP